MNEIEKKTGELMRAYALTFGSPAGQLVLADLIVFCHAVEPSAVEGKPDRSLMNEGRREVLLRAMKFSKMNLDDLYNLHLGRGSSLRTTEGEPING